MHGAWAPTEAIYIPNLTFEVKVTCPGKTRYICWEYFRVSGVMRLMALGVRLEGEVRKSKLQGPQPPFKEPIYRAQVNNTD